MFGFKCGLLSKAFDGVKSSSTEVAYAVTLSPILVRIFSETERSQDIIIIIVVVVVVVVVQDRLVSCIPL